MSDLPKRLKEFYERHLHSDDHDLVVDDPFESNLLSEAASYIEKLEARNKELESAVSDLLETLCDELGLSYVMSNIESIDKACSILSSEHKFSKGGNQ